MILFCLEPKDVTEVIVEVTSESEATVSWKPPSESIQNSYNYFYQGQHVRTAPSSRRSTSDTKVNLEGLFPGEVYDFFVYAVSNNEISESGTSASETMCKFAVFFHLPLVK